MRVAEFDTGAKVFSSPCREVPPCGELDRAERRNWPWWRSFRRRVDSLNRGVAVRIVEVQAIVQA